MAAGFDPYHRWLSIPPSEQPPSHYRLLGLQVFESNFEVIENAAVRQSRHVRGHLESPLRPYATNLLREIEVARLCLLDREAKSAYDSCLRQRQEYQAPAKSRATSVEQLRTTSAERSRVEAAPNIASAPDFPSEAPISFSATPVPSIHTYRLRGHKRRRGSPLAFLVLWLAGGAMGLLAGYAILCMIDPQYDFLHLMFPDEVSSTQKVERSAAPPHAAALPMDTKARSRNSGDGRPHGARATHGQPRRGSVSEEPVQKAIDTDEVAMERFEAIPAVDPRNANQVVIDLKPVVVPFDLTKRVIRFVCVGDQLPTANVRCNVSASNELGMAPIENLPLGKNCDALFTCGINDVTVGCEIVSERRSKSILIEIRPKFRLPSGDEEAFYKVSGIQKAKELAKQVSVAMSAERSLPSMRSELANIQVLYQAVLPTATSPTTSGRYLTQVAAQRKAAALLDRGAALKNQIQNAERISGNLRRWQLDLAAIQQLGKWGAEIARTATLSVCIHHEGTALVAEAR